VSDMCLTKAGDGLTGGLVLSSPEFTPVVGFLPVRVV
jgi:hypothetical protein